MASFPQAGQLEATVEYAKGLKDKDWFGRQDPYAVINLGGQQYRTKTHKGGGTNPAWNESFLINVNDENELTVTIRDSDHGKKDDTLGHANISLATVRVRGWDRIQAPVLTSSNKERGLISLALKFTPTGGAAAAPQVPLQQPGIPLTAIPGYGCFSQPPAAFAQYPGDLHAHTRSPGSPEAAGQRAAAAGSPVVFGQPAAATGFPSPYAAAATGFPSPYALHPPPRASAGAGTPLDGGPATLQLRRSAPVRGACYPDLADLRIRHGPGDSAPQPVPEEADGDITEDAQRPDAGEVASAAAAAAAVSPASAAAATSPYMEADVVKIEAQTCQAGGAEEGVNVPEAGEAKPGQSGGCQARGLGEPGLVGEALPSSSWASSDTVSVPGQAQVAQGLQLGPYSIPASQPDMYSFPGAQQPGLPPYPSAPNPQPTGYPPPAYPTATAYPPPGYPVAPGGYPLTGQFSSSGMPAGFSAPAPAYPVAGGPPLGYPVPAGSALPGYSSYAAYPPAGYPPQGQASPYFPATGAGSAEEDRMVRHALPRFGTGKESPKRKR